MPRLLVSVYTETNRFGGAFAESVRFGATKSIVLTESGLSMFERESRLVRRFSHVVYV